MKPTGDANIDVAIRCLNDLGKTIMAIFTEMNKELRAFETPDGAFKGSLNMEQLSAKCQIKADKRVPSRAIIAKRRAEITPRLIILFKLLRAAMPEQSTARKSDVV